MNKGRITVAITTKTGDKGKTSLLWGGRVSKDNIRVDTYGTLDELCSFLGMAKSLIRNKRYKVLIENIQRDLFTLGAEIATRPGFVKRLKKRLGVSNVKKLDSEIGILEKKKTFEECRFYLPGSNLVSSSLDISRTIARRAERRIVALKRRGGIKNPRILIYLNRLSDLLYLLARAHEYEHIKV